MILDFRFENFRSFHHEARLRMVNAGDVSRVAAIYGPNASGKTTVVHAMAMMRGIVLSSSSVNSTDTLSFQPFLLALKEGNREGLFEISFSVDSGTVFRYGFTMNETAITNEWLFKYRHLAACIAGEEECLYVRDGSQFDGSLAEAKEVLARTIPNMLLIAKLDQDNNPVAHDIMSWFRKLVIVAAYSDDNLYEYSHKQVMVGPYRSEIMELVRFADPTIASVHEVPADLNDITDPARHQTARRNAQAHGLRPAKIEFLRWSTDTQDRLVALPFDGAESAGTQKVFCLAGPLSDILTNGLTLVVDEIDSKFHPALTQKLVSLFSDDESNSKNAQLIVTTHDVELMRSGLLRPDQVFFTEKNLRGESSLYALANFKMSQDIASGEMANGYLRGIFGAVPSFELDSGTQREESAHE